MSTTLFHNSSSITAALGQGNSNGNGAVDSRSRNEAELRGTEVLYHSLIEQLPVCVFRKDAEGRFIFVNTRFCLFKRRPASQILGKKVQDLSGPDLDVEQDVLDHSTIMQTAATIEREEEYKHPDGTVQHFQVVKSPVFSSDGTTIGSQGLLLDITQRKEAEAELAAERDLLRSLLDISLDHVYFKDTECRFIRASNELCKRFGVSAVDIVGKTGFDFFHPDHAQSSYEDEQEIIRTGKPIIGKVERERLLNEEDDIWVLTSKMPLRNQDGEIIGTFGISKDITAIKQAEKKLEEVHKQLLHTSRMAGMAEVATSVLHNVGNVLNSVNTSCALISDKVRNSKISSMGKVASLLQSQAGNLPAFFADTGKGAQLPGYLNDLAKHLATEQEQILAEVVLLNGNIEHIKEIVAMQQSYARVSGVIEPLPPVELVEDALRMNAGAIERHKVRIVREFADTPPIFVEKHKVLQILVNLIRNAKYALDEAGISDKIITLRIEANGEESVKISVCDNGVGIPPENLTRIFAHGFTTRKEGHGFGLHSGALAAVEMGGSLSVQSDGRGKGATFILELPCRARTAEPA